MSGGEVFTVGRTKVRVASEGCTDCGTVWSSGWHEAQIIPVSVGRRGKARPLQLWRCADCQYKHTKEQSHNASNR